MTGDAWTDISLPGDLSKQVAGTSLYRESDLRLAVFPFNKHNPELSTWWHFPAARSGKAVVWPAYHTGKLIFDKPGDRLSLRAGLHVEKGLGREQARAFGSSKANAYELKPTWAWHRFLADLRTGVVTVAADDLGRRTGLPVDVEISVGAPLDEPRLVSEYSEYRFGLREGGVLAGYSVREAEQKLPAVKACSSLLGLGDALEQATVSAPWFWVNVVIGTLVPIGERSGRRWGGAEFWELACEPLLGWVV